MVDFAGIVLAGGASSRMGRDKALLEMDGTSLLENSIQRLRAAGADPVIVSGARPGFDAVPDQVPGRGPLGGVSSVLSARPQLHDRLILVLPVDTPGLDAGALGRLAQAARDSSGAVFAGHPLPLAVWNTRVLRRTLRTLLEETGKASARNLAQRLGVRILPPVDVNLDNMNTPEDWRRFRQVPA